MYQSPKELLCSQTEMLPHAPETMQAWLKLCVCSVLTEACSWKAQSLWHPLLLLPALGFETTPCSTVWTEDWFESEAWAFQLHECRVPDELRNVWFFWHCVCSFFSTCSCAVPQAEIFPVLSLNALAEFWRRHLAERRFPFKAWGYRHGGVSSGADVAVCISFPSSLFVVLLIWKGFFVNYLPFLPLLPRDPVFKLVHFPYLKLHVFYSMEGFVLFLLLRLFYLLPKVRVLHFEDLK